jgi:hypothetical protein
LSWLEASRAGATVIGQGRGRNAEQHDRGENIADGCDESSRDLLSSHPDPSLSQRSRKMRVSTLAKLYLFAHKAISLFFYVSRVPDLTLSVDTLSPFDGSEEVCGTECRHSHGSDSHIRTQACNTSTVISSDCGDLDEIPGCASSTSTSFHSSKTLESRDRARLMWRQTMNAVTRMRSGQGSGAGTRGINISHHFTDFGSSAISAAAVAVTSRTASSSSPSLFLNAEKTVGSSHEPHFDKYDFLGPRG